jgi:RelA/SpoT family (p)ppGpp synthetase
MNAIQTLLTNQEAKHCDELSASRLVGGRRLLISHVCDLIDTYLKPDEVKEVYRAYLFSAEAHEGQKRLSGEPYIHHPLSVAYILAEMQMDAQTLCAAILHDVIEDTAISKEKLAVEFGEEIAELVDGVSKINQIQFETREQAQAANFRKMLFAMNRDIRVIIVKLADRLHNMRTIKVMKLQSQRRIARETLEIYAPIAGRLGMNKMRMLLEELSFGTLYPLRYKILAQRLNKLRLKRKEHTRSICTAIAAQLAEHHVIAEVHESISYPYSLYHAMLEKKGANSTDRVKSFHKSTKSFPIQIIVDRLDNCYRALGIVHSLYKPVTNGFADYIAIPKTNGYQSLHTVLMGPRGTRIEVQIRTTAMQKLAESGIVAHGLYKLDSEAAGQLELSGCAVRQHTSQWLRDLLDMPKITNDSLEFLEQVKLNLFPEEVYVFTPKGDIIQLPKGATAIDFAYAIHRDVGNHCIAVKINQQYVSLATSLASGQTVEVVTSLWARPNPSWLNFAVSARARSHILHYLKNLTQEEAVALGKRLLDKELATYNLTVEGLTEEQRTLLTVALNDANFEALLMDIGLGNKMALVVASQFEARPEARPTLVSGDKQASPLIIKGSEGIVVNFARCCCPIPYDEIVGFFSAGKGITIHVANCKNIRELRNHPEKCLAVEWENAIEKEFLVDIRIDVRNQRGVLGAVTTALANMGSNIEHVVHDNRDKFSSTLKFWITVRDRKHLANIVRHLRQFDMVTRVQRNRG